MLPTFGSRSILRALASSRQAFKPQLRSITNHSNSEFPRLGVAVTVFRERNPQHTESTKENRKHGVNVTPGMAPLMRVTDHEVLLVQRGREPMKGMWSLPGGKVELGEGVEEAAKREVKEECCVDIELGRPFYATNAIIKDQDGTLTYHYGLVHVLASVPFGQATHLKACDDASEVRWVPVSELPLPQYEKNPCVPAEHVKGVEGNEAGGGEKCMRYEALNCVPGVGEVVEAALKIVNGRDCEYWLPSYADDMSRNVASVKYEGYTS